MKNPLKNEQKLEMAEKLLKANGIAYEALSAKDKTDRSLAFKLADFGRTYVSVQQEQSSEQSSDIEYFDTLLMLKFKYKRGKIVAPTKAWLVDTKITQKLKLLPNQKKYRISSSVLEKNYSDFIKRTLEIPKPQPTKPKLEGGFEDKMARLNKIKHLVGDKKYDHHMDRLIADYLEAQ